MNKQYQVFVSSTYSDLKDERRAVIQTLMELDCIPAGMELFPAADEEQFKFIQKIIDDCDYYSLIIGGRYGSISPTGLSYTELEYDYAREKELQILSFVHQTQTRWRQRSQKQTLSCVLASDYLEKRLCKAD